MFIDILKYVLFFHKTLNKCTLVFYHHKSVVAAPAAVVWNCWPANYGHLLVLTLGLEIPASLEQVGNYFGQVDSFWYLILVHVGIDASVQHVKQI